MFRWGRRERGTGRLLALLTVAWVGAALASAPSAHAVDGVGYSATIVAENTSTTPADLLLTNVVDVAVDSSGATYVADPGRHRVDRVDANGTRTVFAGTGRPGNAWNPQIGDATQVNLGEPYGLAIDAQDNVYIADLTRHALLVVTPGGKLTVLAGDPAVAQTDGAGHNLAPVPGAASTSPLHPVEVAVAPDGTVYASDQSTSTVVAVAGGTLTVVANRRTPFVEAGRTTYPLYSPVGLAVRTDGDLLIADKARHQIYAVRDGQLTLVAGSGYGPVVEGPATSSGLKYPERIALDDQGNLYIADEGNDSIDVVDEDQTLRALQLSGYSFKKPTGITARGSAVLIADKDNKRVVRWSPDAQPTIDAVAPVRAAVGTSATATLTGTRITTWSLLGTASVAELRGSTLTWTPARAGTWSVTVRTCAYLSRACAQREVALIGVATLPDAPVGVSATPDGNDLDVVWSPGPADGGDTVTGHVITVTDVVARTSRTLTVGAPHTAVVTGVAPGRTYSVAVAAVNTAGAGPSSTAVTVSTPAAPVPTATPTTTPTAAPTTTPTAAPTSTPTAEPTSKPTAEPTSKPTAEPTSKPTAEPTSTPTNTPTAEPTTPTPAPSSAAVVAPSTGTPSRPVPATAPPATSRPSPVRATAVVAPPVPAPDPTTVPTTAPAPRPRTPAPFPSSTPVPATATNPTNPSTPSTPAPSPRAAGTPHAPRPPALLDRLPSVVAEPVRALATVSVAMARQAQYPTTAFALAGLFLLAQRRIDRNDPKLALAPVEPDHRIPFETSTPAQEGSTW